MKRVVLVFLAVFSLVFLSACGQDTVECEHNYDYGENGEFDPTTGNEEVLSGTVGDEDEGDEETETTDVINDATEPANDESDEDDDLDTDVGDDDDDSKDEELNADEAEDSGLPLSVDTPQASITSTIQFGTIQVNIGWPNDWEIVTASGSPLPSVARTYNFSLIPPNGGSLGTVTVGNSMTARSLSAAEFTAWYSSIAEIILRDAVEETAEFTRLSLSGGAGVFAIFTYADLVGTTPPSGRYLYLGMFVAHWDNGFRAHATLLSNDTDDFYFNLMMLAISLMELSFTTAGDSLTVEAWDRILEAPVFDLAGVNLYNHDLIDSEFLTSFVLESTQGAEHLHVKVPVIVGGEAHRPYRYGTNEVIWDAGGIGMLYYLVPNAGTGTGQNVLDMLDSEVRSDLRRLLRDGFVVNTDHPLRASPVSQARAASFGFSMTLRGEPNATYIYVMQDIQGSDYTLFLLLMLFPNSWSNNDYAILAELSDRIGIDLTAHWP